jgi:hypothetical protein
LPQNFYLLVQLVWDVGNSDCFYDLRQLGLL